MHVERVLKNSSLCCISPGVKELFRYTGSSGEHSLATERRHCKIRSNRVPKHVLTAGDIAKLGGIRGWSRTIQSKQLRAGGLTLDDITVASLILQYDQRSTAVQSWS
jgi:hypothetical protein